MFKLNFSTITLRQSFMQNFISTKNILTPFNSNLSNLNSRYHNCNNKNIYNHSLNKFFSTKSKKENENNSLQLNNSFNQIINNTTISDISLESSEPEDYRTIYIENLPQEWTEDEIKVRLQQIGPIIKLHVIKDSVGMKVGKILAVYQKVEHVIKAIDTFKDKMPLDKPVKIRFFREFLKIRKNKSNKPINSTKTTSSVLIVKNLPDDLRKEDLNLFISEFKQPIHISYPRDHDNEFKKLAFIYFQTNEDAEYVMKYANMRYVNNKQLFFQFSFNHFDINDFRTRIELGIKLEPALEIKFYERQIAEYKLNLENKKAIGNKLTGQEQTKLDYLIMRRRKLEYAIGLVSVNRQNQMLEDQTAPVNKQKSSANKLNSKRILKKDKVDYNDDKSILFFNSHKYLNKN
jgi:hypothetical protein